MLRSVNSAGAPDCDGRSVGRGTMAPGPGCGEDESSPSTSFIGLVMISSRALPVEVASLGRAGVWALRNTTVPSSESVNDLSVTDLSVSSSHGAN